MMWHKLPFASSIIWLSLLRQADIEVEVVPDTSTPVKPDAIFPNNWISFHENGLIVTYPMQAEVRRQEVREDIVDSARQNVGLFSPLGIGSTLYKRSIFGRNG